MTLNVGTIMVSTWGYDQTNVDFYRVTRSTASSLWLEPVGQEVTEVGAFMSEYVVPTSKATGPVFRRKAKTFMGETVVGLQDRASAWPWNGKPVLQTHYA